MDVASALRCVALYIGIDQKILERFEQERTESPPIRIRVLQQATFKNHDKKILRQILRIGHRKAAAANEGKNRPPIRSTKLTEGSVRLALGAVPAGLDDAPMGRSKLSRAGD